MTVQLRIMITDPELELEAYVVVDSLANGRAMGGTRMTSTVDVNEVANLAHNMTLKLALAGLSIGGAKAGIRSNLPLGPERDRVVEQFGRAIAPLLHGGIYLGIDQGISFLDRDLFLNAAHFEMSEQIYGKNLLCNWAELWDHCKDITGFGICEGLVEASKFFRLYTHNCTVAIQGFGAVGRGVALDIERRGFRVVAVADRYGTIASADGLPLQALVAATDSAGTIDRASLPTGLNFLDEPEAWLNIEADVLILAANGNALHEGNVDRVRSTIVVEGGNFACAPAAHRLLAERKIPVLPAVVVNAGGATVTGLVFSGLSPEVSTVTELVQWLYAQVALRISRNIAILLDRSILDSRPLSEIAETVALELIESQQR